MFSNALAPKPPTPKAQKPLVHQETYNSTFSFNQDKMVSSQYIEGARVQVSDPKAQALATPQQEEYETQDVNFTQANIESKQFTALECGEVIAGKESNGAEIDKLLSMMSAKVLKTNNSTSQRLSQ